MRLCLIWADSIVVGILFQVHLEKVELTKQGEKEHFYIWIMWLTWGPGDQYLNNDNNNNNDDNDNNDNNNNDNNKTRAALNA